MAAQRHFESASQRNALDCRDQGLGARFHPRDDVGKVRRHRRLIEFADVRARDEVAPRAANDHCIDVRPFSKIDRLHQALTFTLRKRIYRRVVDRDQQNAVTEFMQNRH